MEQNFIHWLEENYADVASASGSENVLLGIGDDGAVIDSSQGKQVLVADAIVDQVHFDLSKHQLKRIGHKALAVNLSDIAAMGAVAETALVSFVLPRSFEFAQVTELFSGIAETAQNHGVQIVGGDTCLHDGALMVSVAATGRIAVGSKVPGGWTMSGGQVGDVIVVTGALGGSIHGKHLDFVPRLDVARDIQQRAVVHAATDISDSLSIDLSHMLRKSKLGAVLDIQSIPVADVAANTSERMIESALQDGEDFELLMSMTQDALDQLEADSSFPHRLEAIGVVTAENVGQIRNRETGELISASGYEHR